MVLTKNQKVGLAVGSVAAAAVAVGTGIALAKKPPTLPPGGAAGEVSLIITKRRMGYPSSLPADVTFTVNGKALTGIPAPDMKLSVELMGENVPGWVEIHSWDIIPAVPLNVVQTRTKTFTPADFLTKGYSATGYGSFKARARIQLMNPVGTWGKYTAEGAFSLGVTPVGSCGIALLQGMVRLTGNASAGDPPPDLKMSLYDTYPEAPIASSPLYPAVPLNTPKTFEYTIPATLTGKHTYWGVTTLSNVVVPAGLNFESARIIVEPPTGEITTGLAKARCKVCGSPLKVALPRTRCSKCGSTYKVKTR